MPEQNPNAEPPFSAVNIPYLFRYLKPYWFLVVLTIIFMVGARITGALDPLWLKKIIDGVTEKKDFASLLPVVLTFFAFKFGTSFLDYLRDVTFAPAQMGISRTLSHKLFSHLVQLPIAYHVEQKIGGLARKITRGSRAVSFILDFTVMNILPTVVGLVVTSFFLISLYPPIYAIIIFSTVIFYAWFTIWSTQKRQKYRLGSNMADDEVASIEVDALTNIETVKYFNNEPLMEGRYVPAINQRYKLTLKSNRLFALIAWGQGGVVLIGLGIVLFLGIREAAAGRMTVGDLVLLSTYVIQLSAPIEVLGWIYREIKDGLTDLDGMAKVLQVENTITEPENPQHISKPRGEVAFNNVAFSYAGRAGVLKDVSLQVKPGQKVAFVGPSGAGKSTIVKLLFRLFEPTEGEITVDGVPLKQLSKDDRRSIFAIVPQEPVLFNSTIAENIRFGKPNATMAEINAAAKLASIDHVIERFPEKYDTVVGERGVKLSGGEKQRVAIARAVIRNPKILVFDEATSSLDSHSEQEIQQALDLVAKGRTTLAVAHRLSTISDSDTIFVLDKGKVAEQGTHDALLKKNGLYAKLWKIQASGKDPELQEREESE